MVKNRKYIFIFILIFLFLSISITEVFADKYYYDYDDTQSTDTGYWDAYGEDRPNKPFFDSWDTSTVNVKKNSNVSFAFDLIKNDDRSIIIGNSETERIERVYNNPKEYYGTILKMNGYVESSPRTLYWDMFTTVCEVKITVDSVPVDVIIISPSSIRLAERITVYGYPCGILYGGFSKYLQIVGIKK